jgi:hypothetical protein
VHRMLLSLEIWQHHNVIHACQVSIRTDLGIRLGRILV